ncbi:nucleotide sugar dehydrogenase [Thermus thermophilus]|uniref:UDP-glucose dehydrogenase family protein n=1 Tax=Thermus thermophilus TaxID=274 RepID=UPI00090A8BD9|nr:UDP-glucose/GDP-mannose dehydrogenase family protein [Thermus thermophilus]BAW01131.1 nucleotide sugar dehydrogenase [Thermus thermophilus]BDB11798.1 UDP-glucose 6-dehydrogenase [Thermus thermophilus]
MKVAVIGTGYVGLTTALSLAYVGHEVVGVDLDEGKVAGLKRGEPPFYEPHAKETLALVRDRLSFTTRYEEAIPQAEVVFLAVGTPSLEDGSPDLSQVREAAWAIGRHLGEGFTVVVNKSTVPVGSGNYVEALVRRAFREAHGGEPDGRLAVASNPEFLREGQALYDSLYPDRIVVGAEDKRALEVLRELYEPILEQSFAPPPFLPRPEHMGAVPFVTTDLASAELIKYGANAFLALKISFINELARLAERVGADIREVARGIGLDSRIGPRFLQAGLGWGGSCFPKDTAALLAMAREYGLSLPITEAARAVNFSQRELLVEKLLAELKTLKGRTIALLGLAFKPNTDDLRESPALALAELLLKRGAFVRAHDPVALPRAKREVALPLEYAEDPRTLLEGADAVVLATDWPEYRTWPWGELKGFVRIPLVVDGRNFLDGKALAALGYRYVGLGVPALGTLEGVRV